MPALMGYAVLVHAAVQFRAGVGIDLANSRKILSPRPLPSWPCVWPIYFPLLVLSNTLLAMDPATGSPDGLPKVMSAAAA